MESLSEFLENLGYMTFSHEGFWAVLAVVVAVVVIYQLLGAFALRRCGGFSSGTRWCGC